MNKHTPGPWSWWTSCSFRRLSATRDGDVLHAVIQRGDGHPDIHFPNGGSNGPDARLIATSPDFYDASVSAIKAMNDAFDLDPGMDDDEIYDQMPTSALAVAYFSIRAAIAKARGEA